MGGRLSGSVSRCRRSTALVHAALGRSREHRQPKCPSTRYATTTPSPIDGAKATARPMIAKICNVIGIGQNGTCAFTEAVISAEPASDAKATRTTD